MVDYFPFKEFRKGQKEVLLEIQEHLLNPDIKVIMLEAPTGSGKSAFALACARAAQNAYIMTANKMLQDQYLKDFDEYMADLRGRATYPCKHLKIRNRKTNKEEPANCANSPCRRMKRKKGEEEAPEKPCAKDPCEFQIAFAAAHESPITSFNFAAALAYLNYVPLFEKRNLLVIDEAHNTCDQLTDFASLTMSRRRLAEFGINEIANLKDHSAYKSIFGQYAAQLGNFLSKLPEGSDSKVIEELEGLIRSLAFIAKQDLSNYVVDKEFDKINRSQLEKLSFRPIRPGKLASDYLFNKGTKAVMLSATILDFYSTAQMLGLNWEEVAVVRMPSTFPPERRPIITSIQVDRLNAGNIDRNLPRIAQRVGSILDHYPKLKGIIHGHSYRNCEYIYKNVNDKRILYPKNAFEQKEIMEHHVKSDKPTILLSPSMTEGLDLKNDESRLQIIVKIPYPYLGDSVIRARKDIYEGFYALRTALTLIQSYGRSMRHEKDWCLTFVLDGGFEYFVQSNLDIIPLWVLKAINARAQLE